MIHHKTKRNKETVFMRTKKTLAILLYLAYATFLILFITFGSKSASIVAAFLQDKLTEKHIKDVTVDVSEDEELLASRTYYLQFTAHGRYRGDSGLVFESLDPEYLEVNDRGAVKCSMGFEGDSFDGKIKVTSKFDETFEKIFTFHFIKRSPDKFTVSYYMKGYGYADASKEIGSLYTGIPVYVSSDTSSSTVSYNVSGYTVIYDEEYFERSSDGGLVPIKATADGAVLTFSVVYENGNGATSEPFTIYEPEHPYDEIDEIRLAGSKDGSDTLNNLTVNRGWTFAVELYNDGEQVITDYALSCEEPGMTQSKLGYISFTTPGEKHLTFTLPNGFEYKCAVNVQNIVKLPTINNDTSDDMHVIKMLDTDVKTFKLNYPSDVTYKSATYEYDSSMIKIEYDAGSFTVTGKKHGTTTVKIILDDGLTRLEDEYTVELKENKEVAVLILNNLSKFVAKILGHMTLFVALGFLSMNMLRFFGSIYRGVDRFVIYLLTGIPSAALTEFIQLYMPGRSGRFEDVLIDMLGFILGTVAFLLIFGIYRIYMSKREKGRKALDNLRYGDGLTVVLKN